MDAARRASSPRSCSSRYRGDSICRHGFLSAACGLLLGLVLFPGAGEDLELCTQACLVLGIMSAAAAAGGAVFSDGGSACFPGLTKVCGREHSLK